MENYSSRHIPISSLIGDELEYYYEYIVPNTKRLNDIILIFNRIKLINNCVNKIVKFYDPKYKMESKVYDDAIEFINSDAIKKFMDGTQRKKCNKCKDPRFNPHYKYTHLVGQNGNKLYYMCSISKHNNTICEIKKGSANPQDIYDENNATFTTEFLTDMYNNLTILERQQRDNCYALHQKKNTEYSYNSRRDETSGIVDCSYIMSY